MVSYTPTRFLSHGRRVFKSDAGKYFTRTPSGSRTYRPKVSAITRGDSTFTVKHHHRVYRGGKPVAKYSHGHMGGSSRRHFSTRALLLRRILSRRAMM
jgi:hypothetical protein